MVIKRVGAMSLAKVAAVLTGMGADWRDVLVARHGRDGRCPAPAATLRVHGHVFGVGHHHSADLLRHPGLHLHADRRKSVQRGSADNRGRLSSKCSNAGTGPAAGAAARHIICRRDRLAHPTTATGRKTWRARASALEAELIAGSRSARQGMGQAFGRIVTSRHICPAQAPRRPSPKLSWASWPPRSMAGV